MATRNSAGNAAVEGQVVENSYDLQGFWLVHQRWCRISWNSSTLRKGLSLQHSQSLTNVYWIYSTGLVELSILCISFPEQVTTQSERFFKSSRPGNTACIPFPEDVGYAQYKFHCTNPGSKHHNKRSTNSCFAYHGSTLVKSSRSDVSGISS